MRQVILQFLLMVLMQLGGLEGVCRFNVKRGIEQLMIGTAANQNFVGVFNSSITCPSSNSAKISFAFYINWDYGVENLDKIMLDYFKTLNNFYEVDLTAQLTFRDVKVESESENLLQITTNLRCVSHDVIKCIASTNKLLQNFKVNDLLKLFADLGIETETNTGEWKIPQTFKINLMIFRLKRA